MYRYGFHLVLPLFLLVQVLHHWPNQRQKILFTFFLALFRQNETIVLASVLWIIERETESTNVNRFHPIAHRHLVAITQWNHESGDGSSLFSSYKRISWLCAIFGLILKLKAIHHCQNSSSTRSNRKHSVLSSTQDIAIIVWPTHCASSGHFVEDRKPYTFTSKRETFRQIDSTKENRCLIKL